jgi:hypothetical protein
MIAGRADRHRLERPRRALAPRSHAVPAPLPARRFPRLAPLRARVLCRQASLDAAPCDGADPAGSDELSLRAARRARDAL